MKPTPNQAQTPSPASPSNETPVLRPFPPLPDLSEKPILHDGPTPGPYEETGHVYENNGRFEIDIVGATPTDDDGSYTVAVVAGETEARANANAAFIVTACNSHASTLAENKALREALGKAVNLLAKVEACEMAEYCGANVGDYLNAAEEGMAALSLGGAQ